MAKTNRRHFHESVKACQYYIKKNSRLALGIVNQGTILTPRLGNPERGGVRALPDFLPLPFNLMWNSKKDLEARRLVESEESNHEFDE